MSDQTALYQWTGTIREHFGHLSKPQAAVLALWSLGMVLTRSCALTAIGVFWATGLGHLGHKEDTVRQRLREWCYDAADKAGAQRGTKRRVLAVETCFVPLLAWGLSRWQGTQLALALDATSLGERFVELAASVQSRVVEHPDHLVGVLDAQRREHQSLRRDRRRAPVVAPAALILSRPVHRPVIPSPPEAAERALPCGRAKTGSTRCPEGESPATSRQED